MILFAISATFMAIADRAFSYYYDLFTSVKIPDTVTSIGDYAFDGVATMTSIIRNLRSTT